jgi:hypothetical protein
MGIDLSKLTTDTPAQLAAVAATLGLSVLDLMGAAGISLTDLVTAWNAGVAITSLDPVSLGKLNEISQILGVSIFTLLDNMGFDIKAVATSLAAAIQDGINGIPDLPQDIKDQLATYLTAIAESGDNETLNTNTRALNDYVATLPEDIRTLIEPILNSLGVSITGAGEVTLGTVSSGIEATNETMKLVEANTGPNGAIVTALSTINSSVVALGGVLEAQAAAASAFFEESAGFTDHATGESSSGRGSTSGETSTGSDSATVVDRQTSVLSEKIASLERTISMMHRTMAEQNTRIINLQQEANRLADKHGKAATIKRAKE